jgi:hypothetical protein
MRITHRTTGIVMSIAISVLLASVISVLSGTLDSPGTPSATSSYTLEDIYNRLNIGTAGTQSAFTEPAAGPVVPGTMHTLIEIMGKAPMVDDVSGAAVGDVLAGKTFWGRTSGEWGPRIGTLATQTLSAANDTVTAGYYAATKLSTVDSDLAAGNIKKDVDIFGVVGTYGGSGGSTSVPRTGQTSTMPLDPAPTGSDGALQKGLAWPNPRFTDKGDGTVTDNLTGLIWLKNANCFETKNWATALTDCNTLAAPKCGLTDGSTAGQWRLPNYFELVSLLDLAYSSPALSNDAGTGKWVAGAASSFTGVQSSNYYWSSTTRAVITYQAWSLDLNFGGVNYDGKTNMRYVWPVRGGQ